MRHLVILAVLFAAAPARANESYLFTNEYLFRGQQLVAPHCYFRLIFQDDGNLVLYDFNGTPRWASGTNGSSAAYVVMQDDGNLVMYDFSEPRRVVWAFNRYPFWNGFLTVQDDGNVVAYRGFAYWATGTNGETLGASWCPPSSKTTYEANTNRYGGDYTFFDLYYPEPLQCANACAEDWRCNAYTYLPPGVQGSSARCWLKNSVPGTSWAPGLVSGVIAR